MYLSGYNLSEETDGANTSVIAVPEWDYYQSSSSADLNMLAQGAYDIWNYANPQEFDLIWQQGVNQTAFNVSNSTQFGIGCMGGRILNNSDKAFVPINYTTGQFAFRAGFKVFNWTFENEFPIVQSAQSPSAFNVTLVDTSFVTPNGAANIGLSAFQFANISQPVAADLKPTFRWFDQVTFGARDYIFTNP
jgi:hypothetical protein